MKKIRALLCVIAILFAGTAYGDTITGIIFPPTPGVVVDLSDKFGNIVDSTLVMDPQGKYSLTVSPHGDFTVTPSLPGYTFSPPFVLLRMLPHGEYPRANFSVTPDSGMRNHRVTGTGVVFSGTLLGFDSISNMHFADGAYVAGAQTFMHGSVYKWRDPSGATAMLIYNGASDTLEITMVGAYSIRCSVGSAENVFASTSCGSVGILFDMNAGLITFTATPIQFFPSKIQKGVTVTGSLSFPSF